VGDQQQRQLALARDPCQQVLQPHARECVHCRKRLVEQQHGRRGEQAARDRHPLRLSTRELLGQGIGVAGQADFVEQRRHPLPVVRRGACAKGDVLRHRQPGEQPRFLEDQADVRTGASAHAPIDPHAAAVAGIEPGDDRQQAALAATAGADQADDFTGRQLQAHAAQYRACAARVLGAEPAT
jgi:hypothetical protein